LHLPPLIDELIQLHKRGVDVALVCDHTQARGKYEHPEIEQLRAAGIPLVEGTSQKHKIMHHKFAVRDKTTVLSGSWNFSLSASEENNYFDIVESPERAALFLSKWQEMWDWIVENEPQLQENGR
jgi:phosphatidylserine/phosphatidylglycerophosphate/cardiolipin synthase-like enzyme